MESETDFEEERVLEVEDFSLSDVEETQDKESDPINIDYNSRITSSLSTDSKSDDGSSFENISNVSKFQLLDRDMFGDTSCEELEVSDDDETGSDFVNMQKVILDGICCFASNRHSEAASSYNCSSTNFKDDCVTDAEYMSEDDTDVKTVAGLGPSSVDCSVRRLSFGLSVAKVPSSGKDGISINGIPLTSMNVANSYANSILLKSETSNALDTTDKSPLMTCLEFLKSEFSDGEGTDVEEFSIEEGAVTNSSGMLQSNGSMGCILENAAGSRGVSDFFDVYNSRKSSLTTEFLVDDESTLGENDVDPIQMRPNRKRLSIAGDYANDCPTDEEEFDLLDLKEWTETDESGDVRQITQIKTETSIKLEGDGSGFDSDDLVSTTTATTTTRVVTSVITNPDDESDIDSTFVQQVSEDGIRQSCEITFSERSSSQPGESGCEE